MLLLLALQIMNTGLFAQPFGTIVLKNSSSNIINSLTEYTPEVLLQKKGGFPKNQKTNTDQKHKHNSHIKLHVVKAVCDNKLTITAKSFLINTNLFYTNTFIYSSYAKEITPPPPKA